MIAKLSRKLLHLASLFTLLLMPIAAASADEAFVRVSKRDPHYFELSNGESYVPIGLNLAISRGGAKGTALPEYERWFQKLAENHGNYARVWLGSGALDIEHERSGQYDEERAKRVDLLLDMAKKNGIRLKLCFEYFRHIGDGPQPGFAKKLHHVSQGGPAETTKEFFQSEKCREQFKRKLAWYQKRYGNNPTVFGWELWNEMNCIAGGDWADWTDVMLAELHRLFPMNLAMQSLGSFDNVANRERYRRLCTMKDNDVLQVHRYLDLGAKIDACRGPVDLLAADAVHELQAFGVAKPIILAESGAVEKSHSGPFKLYQKDKAGMILHDVLFAPFFSGAAGPGHIWHWEVYVDKMNLWHHFGRFAKAIEGIDPADQQFRPATVEHERLHVFVLKGRNTVLAWCRDKQNTWQTELAEDQPPQPIEGAKVELGTTRKITVYDPWEDRWTEAHAEGNRIVLPKFSRSIVVKLEL